MRRSWARLLLVAGVLAVATHLATVWALPRLIMWRLARATPADMERAGGVFLPAMTDHLQRRVVMPSPDLMYALCAFDLGGRSWRVQADPHVPHYWSVALYADNSDNFWVANDSDAGGRPLNVLLVGPGQDPALAQGSAGATLVRSPSRRGLLLMRLLVSDPQHELPSIEAARRSLRCEPA